MAAMPMSLLIWTMPSALMANGLNLISSMTQPSGNAVCSQKGASTQSATLRQEHGLYQHSMMTLMTRLFVVKFQVKWTMLFAITLKVNGYLSMHQLKQTE